MHWNDGDTISLYLNDSFKDEHKEVVPLLNETLNRIGITVELTDYGCARFEKCKEQHIKMTRLAGKPRKRFGRFNLEEIEERIKNSSAQAVADELGISRSTLFRRIKEAKECFEDEIF